MFGVNHDTLKGNVRKISLPSRGCAFSSLQVLFPNDHEESLSTEKTLMLNNSMLASFSHHVAVISCVSTTVFCRMKVLNNICPTCLLFSEANGWTSEFSPWCSTCFKSVLMFLTLIATQELKRPSFLLEVGWVGVA